MDRHVFIDWDCTITQEHMYSMFVRSDRSPRSEFGKFIATLENNAEKIKVAEQIVKRLAPLYQAWGFPDDDAIDVLHEAMEENTQLLLPQDSLIRENLKEFLFGSADRIAFLARLISSIQATGREVTILTKGIGACVVRALRTYLPQWLETSATTAKGAGAEEKEVSLSVANANDSKLLRAVVVVDYAGLMWHQGTVSRAAVPCSNKIVQMMALLMQFPFMNSSAASGDASNKVLLVDDSAPQEIKGMASKSLTAPGSSSRSGGATIDFKQVNVEVPNEFKGVGSIWGTASASGSGSGRAVVLDCIAGGPPRNGSGLQPAHLEETLRVARL